MRFIVVFLTSIYTLSLNDILKFSNSIFVLVIPLLGLYHKLENILVKIVLERIIQLPLIEKLRHWNSPSKKRRTELLSTGVL